jgi:hypothetical protein
MRFCAMSKSSLNLGSFKYGVHLAAIPECPPGTCQPASGKAWHYVHNPMTQRNFEPQAQHIEKRRGKCGSWGISMFISRDHAIARFRELEAGPIKNIRKFVGDHVVQGMLHPKLGRMTEPDDKGHFNLHEYKDAHTQGVFHSPEPL